MRLALLLLLASAVVVTPQTFPSVTHPTVIYKVDPGYTREALDAELQGRLLLSATIGADGIPVDIKVVQGLGFGLDEKAAESLQKWRFRPATRGGEPIAVKATIEIRFRLPQRTARVAGGVISTSIQYLD
jgi:TonB family protein